MTHSNSPYAKYLKLLWITAIIVTVDQVTKAAVMHFLPLYHSVPVISGFFNITHIHNPGGAFGFLASRNSGWFFPIFLVATILAMGMVFYLYRRTYSEFPFLNTALAMIFGGAAGNLIDRLRFGNVVDFLDVYVKTHHWPAFNVADSAISIGVMVFLYHLVFRKIPE